MTTKAAQAPRESTSDPSDLSRWYRWGWLPLVGGCALIVVGAMVGSEAYLAVIDRIDTDPWQRWFYGIRGVVVSLLLALYAGWFVHRSRRRLEAARDVLRQRAEQLRERERRIDQRVALDAATRILAHEIRNPLNAMQLNCVVLERALAHVPEDRRERIQRVVGVLRAEIIRLSELSQGYLTGRPIELRREPIELEELAREVIDVHLPAIDERGLQVEVAGDGTKVVADPARLRQLMHNLVRNAIEAVNEGGRIWVRCAPQGPDATLAVADDGPGFLDLGRAFRPFYTTKEQGSGLGLAVVRDIVRMHGGQVEASNRADGGACVTVRLPASGAAREIA